MLKHHVDGDLLAEAELNVLCCGKIVIEASDYILHSLTKAKMLSVKEARSVMVRNF